MLFSPHHFIRYALAMAMTMAWLGAPARGADFQAGDLVVYRVGDGSAALASGIPAPVFIDEYSTSGTQRFPSVVLPTSTVGANHRLLASGTAGSEGQLTRSADGHQVIITGYDTTLAQTGLTGTPSATVPRVIGVINQHQAIDTTTALTDASSGNNPRSAAGDGRGNLWFAGAAGGLRFATVGGTTSILLDSASNAANVSQVEIINGQLWVSSAKNQYIASVSNGLPTIGGQTFTVLPLPIINPNGFVLLQLGPGPFPDTLYEAENTATITKFCRVSGSFVARGSYTLAGVTGLTASVSGTQVTLYATNGATISTVTDTSGYNVNATGSVNTLITAGTNMAFRGIALAPANLPTISDIANQTIAENSVSPAIPIMVGSSEASPSLSLTVNSGNPALLPTAGISLSGGGTSYLLTLTPTIGAIGSSSVQVTVNDATTGLAASSSFTLTVQDTPPTISTIVDQTIVHDTSTAALAIAVGDAETSAANLILSATSSNPGLVSGANIALGGAGANRSITVTPIAGQAGATTITLTVADTQGMTASSSFVLTVSNGTTNTAPTVSAVDNQQITENGATAALAVTVGDQETPVDNLILTASGSSNPILIPVNGITVGGSGANRTVTLTPAAGQIGTSTVTLLVDDTQGLTTSTSFVLTVVDTAPAIGALAAQSILTSTSTATIPLTVSDAETPAASLLLSGASSNATLLPVSGIVITGSGAALGVILTPATGQNGTSTVTLTVDDTQGMTASTSFLLTVSADRPPVAGIHAMTAIGNRITVLPGSQFSALDSDPDGDPVLITAVGGTTAAGGTVALVDGNIIYTPPSAGFTGSDSFSYTLRDGVRVSGPIPNLGSLGWDDLAHTVPVLHSGWGSSLAPVPGTTNEYFLLADRGPNGDTSVLPPGSPAAGDPKAVVFPIPNYDPEIGHVRWNADGTMTLLGVMPILDENGGPLSGRPNPSNASNNFQLLDVPYDVNGNPEAFDAKGLDSEGLVALPDGTFWVSDEYGPWLLHLDPTGVTVERIGPFAPSTVGHKLPLVLAKRLQNKGMEGLTVTPDGSLLVGMMQSALQNDPVNDADGSKNKKNLMTRLITYRLVANVSEAVGTVHQYAYLLGDPATAVASSNKFALSEITAISNTEILVDERDGNFPSDPGGSAKSSWVCHLPSGLPTDATPIDDQTDSISGLTFGGATLETLIYDQNPPAARATLATHGIVVLPKNAQALVNLALVGLDYDHDKVEGILSVNGKVLYSNDDDFGINGSLAKVITGSYPVGSYPLGTIGGLTTDYEQMLEVDPTKLMAATGTITVTVVADTAPTISGIQDQSIPVNNSTGPLPVTIGDAETPATNLVLSAASSNLSLVPASGIVVGGAGANRTITVTPAVGQSGTVQITVTVDDTMGMTASTSFKLIVVAAQTVHFVPLANRVYDLTGTPLAASASSGLPVTFAVVSGPATVVNGANPQVMVTDIGPVVLSATQAGSATVAAASAQQTFTVLVNPILTGGPSYPPPGATFTFTPGGVSAGAAQGTTNAYTGMAGTVAANPALFWGPGSSGVAASLHGSASEYLTFDAADSNLPNGLAAWSGSSTLIGLNGPIPVLTRCLVQVSGIGGMPALPWSVADGYGITDPTVGAIVQIGGDYQVQIQFLAALPGGQYLALDDFYSTTPHMDQNGAFTSFSGAFSFPIATPVLSWSQPGMVGAGTALNGTQLNASASYAGVSVDGSFTYSPPAGTVLVGGSQALSAIFTPSDTLAFASGGAVATTIQVNASPQTISFSLIANQTFGAPPVPLTATASSNLPVAFSVLSGPGTVVGALLTITGAGTVVVAADQAGSALFQAAPEVTQSVVVARQAQTITFPAIATQSYSSTPLSLTATASSGLAPTFSVVSGPATVTGTALTFTGVGTVVVAANQGGNGNLLAAPQVTQTFSVVKGAQTISFATVGNLVFPSAPVTLSATASSGLPVTITVKSGGGIASISGTTLTLSGVGTVVLSAAQAGGSTYQAATTVTQSIIIKMAQAITFTSIPALTYGMAPVNLAASASSALTPTFSVVTGPAKISGSTMTISGAGTVVVAANQAGNGTYYAAPQVTQSIAVAQAARAITVTAPGNQTFGVAPLTLKATSNSGLAPTFTVSSGPATVSGTKLTITGSGTVVVAADQAGNANYLQAPQVTVSIVVAPASQAITFTQLGKQTYGVGPLTLAAKASSGLAPTFSWVSGPATVTGSTLTITGAGAVVVAADQAGNGNYLAAPQLTQTITVAQEAQTITFAAIGNQAFGDPAVTLSATSTSTLPVVFAVTGPATVANGILTITGAGTVSVTASQAGNGNFLAAPSMKQTITVAKEAQAITFAAIANQVFGVAPLALSATASSGLAVTFSVTSGPAKVSGTTLTITGGGTVVVAANQTGNSSFAAAPVVSQTIVVTASDVLAINAGGPAVSNFAADEDHTGGSAITTSTVVSTAGVTNAAPASVYQSARTGKTFSYAIPGLVANGAYMVRVHFAEIQKTGVGQRVIGVAINGTAVLTGFDIIAVAGGPNIAYAQSFPETANGSGQIVISVTGTTGDGLLSGIEIISVAGTN